jgi:SAM-dependent methyltransferase
VDRERAASCGADHSDDRDVLAAVRDGYDLASHAYRGDTFERFAWSGYAYWLRRLEERIAPGSRVLELGCGNGIPVVAELAKRHRVTGVDLSPVQIERARQLVPAARFVCDDMCRVEFEPASFDAITAFFSIIHVPLAEQPALIASIARWLVPGGWFLAVVGREAQTRRERDWRGVTGATMYWSHADVATYRTWFGAAGFTIAEEGVQPETGSPGFSVLIATTATSRD